MQFLCSQIGSQKWGSCEGHIMQCRNIPSNGWIAVNYQQGFKIQDSNKNYKEYKASALLPCSGTWVKVPSLHGNLSSFNQSDEVSGEMDITHVLPSDHPIPVCNSVHRGVTRLAKFVQQNRSSLWSLSITFPCTVLSSLVEVWLGWGFLFACFLSDFQFSFMSENTSVDMAVYLISDSIEDSSN